MQDFLYLKKKFKQLMSLYDTVQYNRERWEPITDQLERAQQYLKQYFGYDRFRPGQMQVIRNLLDGSDTVAIMPTGAGKSLCFQIPALLLPGVTLVVSPLISLMKDQVDGLNMQGIPATFINSSLSGGESRQRLDYFRDGRYKLMYVAPERLESDLFQSALQNIAISMVAVDEAHCLSQWGHDFRPSYRAIKPFIDRLASRPVIGAFTATATPEVKADIIGLLTLEKPQVYITGFDRPNLAFRVLRGEDKRQFVLDYVKAHAGQSGIIYAATRREVDEICLFLRKKGISAGRYHAGLPDQERLSGQEQFIYDEIQVMVATNAFGMGIDKSNVRYVLHYNMPKNLEAYYQEAGRGGRDGEPGECILLFAPQDVQLQKFLIDKSVESPERKQNELRKLQDMVDYCYTPECLRHYILNYFGEHTADEECGNCGNCNDDSRRIDITVEAQKVFSCIYRLRERYGIMLVAEVLKGSKNKRISQLGLERLSTYGLMGQRTLQDIKTLIQRLIATGYLHLTESEYPVVTLTPQAIPVLKNQERVWQKIFIQKSAEPDDSLFDLLRQLRRRIAGQEQVPPYAVFADSTLREMSQYYPQDKEAMARIKGVGERKLQKYGQKFLDLIHQYVKDHPELAAPADRDKPDEDESSKQPSHLRTLDMYRQGADLAAIAKSRGLTVNTVQNHLVRCSQEGYAIDWNRIIPAQYESLIIEKIKEIGTGALKPIKEALPDAVGYDAIKAVLCKHFNGC